jgi:RND family efflux transporter MFP subunit
VLEEGRTRVEPLRREDDLYGDAAREHAILVPLRRNEQVWGVGAYRIHAVDSDALRHARERLELTSAFLELYELRRSLQDRERDLGRVQGAVDVLAAVNACERRSAAAMAFCNEIAARWGMDRVSLGFLEGRYVKLRGLSHTEKIVRKTHLAQSVESSMEECLDQDTEILHPADPEAPYVSRATEELAQAHGPATVCSFPLRRHGAPEAVLTVEREPERPFTQQELETLRLTVELCAPRLLELHERDRWFGARATLATRQLLAKALGPEYTWVKVGVILAGATLAFLIFAQGPHRVEASFKVQPQARRVVPAPFEGFLDEVAASPGDQVQKGEVLARLDRSTLELKLSSARADRRQHEKQASLARREGKTAEAQIAKAKARREAARIDLLEHRLEKAVIHAPMEGHVLKGDLERKVGSPVKKGQTLFEVAPLGTLHAELLVPEDRIGYLHEGMEGQMAATSFPGQYLDITVTRIHPVAEVHEKKNVYRTEVRLRERRPWLRPGMEGLAKVDVGDRSYLWIWTHDLVEWVRMKLWI